MVFKFILSVQCPVEVMTKGGAMISSLDEPNDGVPGNNNILVSKDGVEVVGTPDLANLPNGTAIVVIIPAEEELADTPALSVQIGTPTSDPVIVLSYDGTEPIIIEGVSERIVSCVFYVDFNS